MYSECLDFYKHWLEKLNRANTEENLVYLMRSTPYTVFLREIQTWMTKPIRNFEWTNFDARYEIRQINSYMELYNEGRIMHHCVATYKYSCIQGRCSIWSFSRYNLHNHRKRLLTIEVRDGSIVQAKGKNNSTKIESKYYEVLEILIWSHIIGAF